MKRIDHKRLLERREALLSELGALGPFVAGSFFERNVRGVKWFCVSRMRGGAQRQAYVSADRAEATR